MNYSFPIYVISSQNKQFIHDTYSKHIINTSLILIKFIKRNHSLSIYLY